MKDMGEEPQLERGLYRHFKGGEYEVLSLGCNTDTLEWYVIYESQERKALGLPSIWIRRYDDFVEIVERDGKTFPRFEKI